MIPGKVGDVAPSLPTSSWHTGHGVSFRAGGEHAESERFLEHQSWERGPCPQGGVVAVAQKISGIRGKIKGPKGILGTLPFRGHPRSRQPREGKMPQKDTTISICLLPPMRALAYHPSLYLKVHLLLCHRLEETPGSLREGGQAQESAGGASG